MRLEWDAEYYNNCIGIWLNGQNEVLEARLLSTFPPPALISETTMGAIITNPLTVVDHHGRILCWYLPGILTPHRQVSAHL